MRSPIAWVMGALLLGMALGRRGAWGVAVAIAAVALALVALLRARGLNGAAVFLLVAAVAVGAAIEGAHAPWTPRPALTVTAREVVGVLERPCVARDARDACVVREEDGSRIALNFPSGACVMRAGDAVRAVATVIPVQPPLNDGRLGPGASLARDGVFFRAESASCEVSPRVGHPLDWVRRGGARVRATLSEGIARSFDGPSAARARALLFGDDDALDPSTAEDFRSTGLSHLLAVSGAHVALVAAALSWIVRALAARVSWLAARGALALCEAVVAMPAVVLFVCATGESPSSVRALVMATLALLARLCLRRADGPSLLAASAIVTVSVVPAWRADVGWQLSIAASWALVSAPKTVRDEGSANGEEPSPSVARSLFELARDALVATGRVALLTAPIVASMGGRVPLVGLLANVVAAPVGEVLSLPMVLVAAAIGAYFPWLGALLAKPASWALAGLFAVPSHAARWPLASVECVAPTAAQCAVWLAIVGVGLLARRRRSLLLALGLALTTALALEALHRRECHPRGVLQVTAVDVGQGDALLIDLPDGAAMLVDGGGVVMGADPGERVVVPLLALRRRRALAVVVASHPHPDHVNGLRAVLDWAQVGELWDTRQSEQWNGGARWLAVRSRAESQGVPVRGPESLCRGPFAFHGATMEVLAPCGPIAAGTSPNDGSFVLRLSYRNASVLLPGDLEEGGERALLARLAPVTALKLGHHGSRTSTSPAWLRALSPRVAISSQGHPSPFGHPHPTVVQRLSDAGIPLFSTSEWGLVTLALYPDGRWESRHALGVFDRAP